MKALHLAWEAPRGQSVRDTRHLRDLFKKQMAEPKWRWMGLKPGARWELISPANRGACWTAEARMNIHKPWAPLVSLAWNETRGGGQQWPAPKPDSHVPFQSLRGPQEGRALHSISQNALCPSLLFAERHARGVNVSCISLSYDGSHVHTHLSLCLFTLSFLRTI